MSKKGKQTIKLDLHYFLQQRVDLREQVERGLAQLQLGREHTAVGIFGNLGDSHSGKLRQQNVADDIWKNYKSRYSQCDQRAN